MQLIASVPEDEQGRSEYMILYLRTVERLTRQIPGWPFFLTKAVVVQF